MGLIQLKSAHGDWRDPRITRNVGNLIREESKITEYQDQCGGAYLVEVLTDQIIKGGFKMSNTQYKQEGYIAGTPPFS